MTVIPVESNIDGWRAGFETFPKKAFAGGVWKTDGSQGS